MYLQVSINTAGDPGCLNYRLLISIIYIHLYQYESDMFFTCMTDLTGKIYLQSFFKDFTEVYPKTLSRKSAFPKYYIENLLRLPNHSVLSWIHSISPVLNPDSAPQWTRISVNSLNLVNLTKSWCMNLGRFKDPVCFLCLGG